MSLLNNTSLPFHDFCVLFPIILLLCMSCLVVQFLKRGQIQLRRIKVPKNILEVQSASLAVEEHHCRKLVIGIERLEWILLQENVIIVRYCDSREIVSTYLV